MAMSGHPQDSDLRHNNDTLETYSAAPAPTGAWQTVGAYPYAPGAYPRLHVLPTGEVFCATPMNQPPAQPGGPLQPLCTQKWNPVTKAWIRVAYAPGAGYGGGIDWSSVLLPLAPPDYRTQVLLVGQQTARTLDLGNQGQATSATWQSTANRQLPAVSGRHVANAARLNCNAVILPDGKVLMVGGGPDGDPNHAVLAAELYDPVANSWTTLGSTTIPRGYHSVALLVPSGRVWVGGSDFGNRSPQGKELRIELFSPPYLSAGPRPTIASARANVGYGVSFTVDTPQAQQVASVAMVRCSSVTHAFNADQRYVRLRILSTTGASLTVESPPNPNIAPPGIYLLFVINGQGVPSAGHFIRVS